MTLVLNQSDIYLIRSGEHAKCFVRSPAQTAPPADPWSAPDRADRAWFTDRDLQALRPTQLSLRRWTWTRPQAISVHNCEPAIARGLVTCRMQPTPKSRSS